MHTAESGSQNNTGKVENASSRTQLFLEPPFETHRIALDPSAREPGLIQYRLKLLNRIGPPEQHKAKSEFHEEPVDYARSLVINVVCAVLKFFPEVNSIRASPAEEKSADGTKARAKGKQA